LGRYSSPQIFNCPSNSLGIVVAIFPSPDCQRTRFDQCFVGKSSGKLAVFPAADCTTIATRFVTVRKKKRNVSIFTFGRKVKE
jgi:hypothetical protein